MSNVNNVLCQSKHIRSCEELAQSHLKLSPGALMFRAAKSAFDVFCKYYGHIQRIAVYCGAGNNAGDGYLFAKLVKEAGFAVSVYAQKPAQDLPSPAREAAIEAVAAGVSCYPLWEALPTNAELIVDALLGIGLRGKVREDLKAIIKAINNRQLPILAMDIPSGLHPDTGVVEEICIKATMTVTFIAPKLGLMTADGPDYSGHIICDNLGLTEIFKEVQPAAYSLDSLYAASLFPPIRSKNSHKGKFGHVLIIGGGEGMPGAALMAAHAAARVGAGLVTIATQPKYANTSVMTLPEALIFPIESADELEPLLKKATVCVIGPGLGETPWAKMLYKNLLVSHLPLIVDASALRMLADSHWSNEKQTVNIKRNNWILTPHPGEAAALLNCSIKEVQSDRYEALLALQHQYGGYIILKGTGSLISTGENSLPYLCVAGNPGMATGGMGDVLSGILAGLVAQGLSLESTVKLGTWLHATAGDTATIRRGERGLLASDLMPYLRSGVNQFPMMLS